ncbi:PepSY domain-containing protein, partial [Paracidovorax cattleyae]|uniref:PepSY domain-containing protein n=1 Tax=Paracidovorax cattleyae TaxID=80868 RepID=UPI003EBF05FA
LPPLDLATMVAGAHRTWGDARIGNISARRDADGTVVEVTRHDGDRLQYGPARLRFDGATARQLALIDPQTPAIKTYRVIYGLHLARFAGPGMRWALFGFGVLGSLMIASGLVLWSVKRRAQSQRRSADAGLPFGERLVASLNVGLMGGLPLAVAAFLAANRLLPRVHAPRAPTRSSPGSSAPGAWAWSSVCCGPTGAAGPCCSALQARCSPRCLRSTRPPPRRTWGVTLPAGEWAWAGMDLSFLAAGLVFCAMARHLLRRRAPAAPKAARTPPPASRDGTTPAQGA